VLHTLSSYSASGMNQVYLHDTTAQAHEYRATRQAARFTDASQRMYIRKLEIQIYRFLLMV